MHPLLSLPGNSGQSSSLTANNLKRHDRDLLAQEVKDLKAILAARDEENKVQAAEIEELRQMLAAASAANGTDETESPASKALAPSSDETQVDVQKSGAKKVKSKSKTKSRQSKSKPAPNRHLAEEADGQWYLLPSASTSTSSVSVSSTATMSDLPGPGRAIGKLYSRAGKILELCIYRFAHRCGYGPHAVYVRFFAFVYPKYWATSPYLRDDGVTAKVAIVWDSLLEYALRGTVHTQKTAVRKMWQTALYPRMQDFLMDGIINNIHRRNATLRILHHIPLLEATRAECIGDIVEIRRLSESLCRNLVLPLDHGGRGYRFRFIVDDLAWATIGFQFRRTMKSIIEQSPEAEAWKTAWIESRRMFRNVIRRFRVYFGYISTGEDHRILWSDWLELAYNSQTFAFPPRLQPELMALYDEVSNGRPRM